MADQNLVIKRNNSGTIDVMYPATKWARIVDPPSTFTPTSHTHGNITNGGLIGTTANLPIITGTGGILQAGSFGTGSGTFCQGNDSRLSDARTPTSHTHGDIQNGGLLSSSSITIASADRIVVSDNSASGAIKNGPTFGTDTTTYLRNDGNWASPPGVSALTSIKNWSTYTASNGINTVSLPTKESIVGSGLYALEVNDTTASNYTRSLLFFNIQTGSASLCMVATYSNSSTSTVIYKLELSNVSGVLTLDDVYTHTIPDTSSEALPIATSTTLYVWNIYKVN